RVVLRRRHGRGPVARARASECRRRELQPRERALGGDDLRPRPEDQDDHALPWRDRVPAAPLPRRRAADPERGQGPWAARLRGEGRAGRGARADDRVVPAKDHDGSRVTKKEGARGGTMGSPALIRLARPDTGAEEAAAVAEVLESGMLTMGEKVSELEDE